MSGLPGGVAGGLAASVLPITIEPAKLAEGVALAPDLAWTRIRFRREALVAWLIDQCLSLLQCLIFRWKYGRDAERNALWQLTRGTLRLFWR